MDDEMVPISRLLKSMPEPLGGIMREVYKRRDEYIMKHGVEAYEKHLEEQTKQRLAETDATKEKERSLLRLENSGLAESMKMYTFANFDIKEEWQRKMFDMCKHFVRQNEKWLYISGQPGCGKTHLGTAVAAHYLNKGYPTRYTTFQMLTVKLRSKANDEEAYSALMDEYGGVKVLYIDDFFKPKDETDRSGRRYKAPPTVSDITHAFELINMRLVKGGITIITSERSLEEILSIDEALGSRIKQKCGEYTLDIERKQGRNYRLKG